MPTLAKAKLGIVPPAPRKQRNEPAPIELQDVQFNPATLKLSRKNVLDRGQNRGRQVQQHIGADSESYTLDLHFDSADEVAMGQPMSVRRHTEIVERYLRPRAPGVQPPRLYFEWGDLAIEGVVESLELEFDHFAHTGVPLRAKATLTIKGQDRTLEVLPKQAQQAGQQTQTQPGEPSSGVPGSGAGGADQVAAAQAGETPAEFMARRGLDPAAWRALDLDLEAGLVAGAGLTLAAGAEVGISAGIGASLGIGVHVGFEAGVAASVEASFGLAASAGVAAGASVGFGAALDASLGAGFTLAAAGGVEAALELSAGFQASASVAGSVAAFTGASFGGAPDFGVSSSYVGTSATRFAPPAGSYATAASFGGPPNAGARALPSGPSRPTQLRTPLVQADTRPGARTPLASAPPLPRVDPRARSYGRGLPLRRRVETQPIRPHEQASPPTPAAHPNNPPWEALPPLDRGRRHADAVQAAQAGGTITCACNCPPSPRAPWSIECDYEEGEP